MSAKVCLKRFNSALAILSLLLACISTIQPSLGQRLTQDILRQPKQQQAQQQPVTPSSAIALPPNFELPPQLAQLTPQQLQQLAQLRALQIQQQQQQQQQQQAANTQSTTQLSSGEQNFELNQLKAPGQMFALGSAATSTSPQETHRDQGVSNVGSQASSSLSDQADRNDHDGSYNEANTEQEGVNSSYSGINQSGSSASGGPDSSSPTASTTGSSAGSQAGPTFEVNWNKCPQLEPSESEKNKKTQVITKCLQSAPIPANLTRENVEAHREQIATCALKVEGWFDDSGNYRYDKAENEIRSKKLDGQIEIQVLKFHIACKEEASKKFPREQNKLIDQVQFYQACMDYYISIACEIEVSVDS